MNKKITLQYNPLLTSDIGPDYQLNFLNNVEMHIVGSLNEMTKLLAEAKEKLRKKLV